MAGNYDEKADDDIRYSYVLLAEKIVNIPSEPLENPSGTLAASNHFAKIFEPI